MASDNILDLSKLLAPIAEDSPAGSDVRLDKSQLTKYQTLKTSRSEARAAEKQGLYDNKFKIEADDHWRKVRSLSIDILTTQSKDLEVACWLSEALIRSNDLAGLRDSFKLINGLVMSFWDTLHPMPDEDGMETRFISLTGLNGQDSEGVLIAPIRKLNLTEDSVFSFWQLKAVAEIESLKENDAALHASKIQKIGYSIEEIEKSANLSEIKFYVDLKDDLVEAISLYRNISSEIDKHCEPKDAPSTRKIIETLEECLTLLNYLLNRKEVAKHKPFVPVIEAAQDSESVGSGATATELQSVKTPVISGAINSREAAFAQLLEIAKFFRKTEPHSPVSYVIDKAVKWGNMPLNELISELISDESSRKRYSELTGVESDIS